MNAAAATTDRHVHLNVLTNSALACYRRCPREYAFRYVLRRRPRRVSEALRFGTFFHIGLNAWWETSGEPAMKLEAGLAAMRSRAEERVEDADPFELVKAEELLLGYTARWGDEPYEAVGVEVEFRAPLVNPKTRQRSRTYELGGKLDVIVRHRDDHTRLFQVEHKTTTQDIGLGADYWRRVSALDSQVSTYLAGARAAGFILESCIYDVVRKVTLRPHVATPVEKRRHTKSGELDARQHANDETPDEFRARVRAHITENPERYFARGPVVRLDHDEREHAGDTWQTAWFIREAENAGRFPRNPGACERFHRLCSYFDVCSGTTSIDDEDLFRTSEVPHEELAEV
jgi:hypothetical protein